MSFLDVVFWEPRNGEEKEHDAMMDRWFAFVQEHHDELFPEWLSVRFYKDVDRDSGEHTGRFVILFEYDSHEGFLAYKKRRDGYPGPYQPYLEVDPVQFFQNDTKYLQWWMPEKKAKWMNWTKS